MFAANLDIIGGVLIYTGSAVNNNLSISVSSPSGAGTYTFNDTGETITLGAGAVALGATGTGTNTVQLNDGAVSAMLIDTDGGTDTVNIQSTTDPININTANGVPDTTTIGASGSVDGVVADIFVQDTGGVGNVVVNDFNNPASKTITVTEVSTTGLLPAAHTLNYGSGITQLDLNLGFGGNTVNANLAVNNTLDLLNINSGDASDTVNLIAVNAGLTVNVQTEIGGADATTIGNAGSTADILGFVTVQDAGGVATLTVDDSLGVTNRTVSLTNGLITGMTANPITFQPGITTLIVKTGSGTDAISVNAPTNDDLGTLNIDAGGNSDTVAILATNVGLTVSVNTQNGVPDTTIIGSLLGDGTGSAANVLGSVNVSDSGGVGGLIIDNGGEATARFVTISGIPQVIGATGPGSSVSYGAGITELTVFGGSASDTFDVTPSIAVAMHIHGGQPVSPTLPGDHLDLTLAGAADPTLIRSGDDGTISFSNRAPIQYTSIESVMNGIFTFSTSGYVVNENGAAAVVTVQRVSGSTGTASVTLSQSDGTATSPADYTSQTLVLNFANGETFKNVLIPIVNDALDEIDESFNLTLTNAVNALISNSPLATVTILDDDLPPNVTINDVSQAEGDVGVTPFNFTVSLSAPSGKPVTVFYSTADGTATTANNDYTAATSSVVFAPGETSKQITINVNGDLTIEPNETFLVNLTSATDGTITDNQAIGTILDDDTPDFTIDDVVQNEGTGGGLTSFTFTVTRSKANVLSTVDFTTADGTAVAYNGTSGDYLANAGSLSFPVGVFSQTITVSVRADNTNELDENFLVNLSNAQNGTISDSQGEGTILNDDTSLPQVRINDVAVTEGNSGTKNVTFTITLSKATFKTVTVKFATQNNTAVSSSDYTAKSGTLTFSAFQTSKTITVVTKGDTSIEPDETFFLNLSAPTNAFIADNRGVGTIVNDDKVAPPKPLVSISDVTGVEGNTGTRSFVFTITLSAPAPGAISVKYATSNGTASSSSDYTAKSGTVNFAAGETSKTVTITVKGDVTKEVDETFFVTLTNPIGASINKGVGKGTIRNDD